MLIQLLIGMGKRMAMIPGTQKGGSEGISLHRNCLNIWKYFIVIINSINCCVVSVQFR